MIKIIWGFIFLLLISCVNEKKDMLTHEQRNIEMSKIKTQMAIEFMKNNDFSNAVSSINEAVSLNSNSEVAWLTRALVYQSLNIVDEAEKSYKKALSLNSKNSEILNDYGWFVCSTKNQPAQSMKYFDSALKDPTYSTPYLAVMNKGICEAKLGNFAGAQKDIKYSQLISPNWFKEPTKELIKIKYEQSDFIGAYNLFLDYKKNTRLDADGLLLGWKITKSLNNKKESLIYEDLLKKNFSNSLELKQILDR